MTASPSRKPEFLEDPLWYKDAVIYQLHVRAFYDSDDDGIGDFKGLSRKLDYLKDLGINAIWLLPFYPSPLKDEGYDIADYRQVNPSYGNLRDFRAFLRGARQRGMRVITELVINHTSDQHEWFQLSRNAPPGSYWRDFYVWSDNPQKYKEARIIFRDFETSNWSYDPVAKAYYWHRFYAHQPDLNFNNPEVRKKILRLVDYWFKMGVDGMRLDAVPYLFEREGTSCENLPETHQFLKQMRAHVDRNFEGKMLLAEANQWPEDAARYFGDGDECHMNFHFPIMPRLFMAVKREDRFSLIDIMRQTPPIPENCQWAMFLRNHDELTLEMVTDEERDYMYSVYADEQRARINLGIRRRLAPLLGNDRRQIELLNGILFSLPGTPIIYYGDEIGMGDNIYLGDRNGVRTPFQWSSDRNAGFSESDPQMLYLPVITTPEYHYTTINVENQARNPNSLLRWMTDLIAMRRQSSALTRGSLTFLEPDNQKVLAFIREYESQKVLVIANLSKHAQYAGLDLSEHSGLVPVELRGESAFPAIGEQAYNVTLGPYDFYWFALSSRKVPAQAQWLLRDSRHLAHLPSPRQLLAQPGMSKHFETRIAAFLPKARWFSGKDHTIRRVCMRDTVEIARPQTSDRSWLVFIEVTYKDQKDKIDNYLLTVNIAEGRQAEDIQRERPDLVIAEYELQDGKKGIYHEAIIDGGFAKALLETILRRRKKAGKYGSLSASTYRTVKKQWLQQIPEPETLSLEQSNSSLRFGTTFFLKLYRKIEPGKNPEIEMGQKLNASSFAHVPALIGSLSYRRGNREYAIAALQDFREAKESAWDLFQTKLAEFTSEAAHYNLLSAIKTFIETPDFFTLDPESLPPWFRDETRYTASLMKLIGQRTGAMHRTLGQNGTDPDFQPEEITPFYQRGLYQHLRNRALAARRQLERAAKLPPSAASLRDDLFAHWGEIEEKFETIRQESFGGQRIRIHGDYHLGQVMFTGSDFFILDFEGEPLRPLSTRRLKYSPLQDVAGMLRSIDYAICYYAKTKSGSRRMMPWLKLWQLYMSQCFFNGYLESCAGSPLLPQQPRHIRALTEVLLLEKALYEVIYELDARPDWVAIPLYGVLNLLPSAKRGEVIRDIAL